MLPGEINVENYIFELEVLLLNLQAKLKHAEVRSNLFKRNSFFKRIQTPPSRQMMISKITNLPGKRGASRGHRGTARVMGERDEIIHVKVKR